MVGTKIVYNEGIKKIKVSKRLLRESRQRYKSSLGHCWLQAYRKEPSMNAKAKVNVNTDQAGPLATVPPASGVVSFTKFGPQRVLNWRAAPVYVWERLWLVSADAACQIAIVSLLHQLQVGVDDPGRFRSYGIR